MRFSTLNYSFHSLLVDCILGRISVSQLRFGQVLPLSRMTSLYLRVLVLGLGIWAYDGLLLSIVGMMMWVAIRSCRIWWTLHDLLHYRVCIVYLLSGGSSWWVIVPLRIDDHGWVDKLAIWTSHLSHTNRIALACWSVWVIDYSSLNLLCRGGCLLMILRRQLLDIGLVVGVLVLLGGSV